MRTYERSINVETTTGSRTAKPKADRSPVPRLSPQPAQIPHAAAAVPAGAAPASFMEQALGYQIDRWQRSVLFLDMLRERANNMLAHEEAGMPAPLDFEYETILDARRFERTRLPADESNQFVAIERAAGASISQALEIYREARDRASEQLFSALYGSENR